MTLPHITVPDNIRIGPLPLHIFGLLVATGIVVGNMIARKRAAKMGLDDEKYESLVFWTVGIGIVLSHVFDTIAYHPEVLLRDPLEIIMIHHGLSSFGGFLGAAIAFTIYTRRNKLDPWKYADAICYGLPWGWLFGRMGCASVHDHPGRLSNSAFAVAAGRAWPDASRFDLGLLELMTVPLLIAGVLVVGFLRDKALANGGPRVGEAGRPWVLKRGAIVAILSIVYAPIRFMLDFLRAGPSEGGDPRYFGFTPGQFASATLLAFGLWVALRKDSASPVEELPTKEPKAGEAKAKAKAAA